MPGKKEKNDARIQTHTSAPPEGSSQAREGMSTYKVEVVVYCSFPASLDLVVQNVAGAVEDKEGGLIQGLI